MKTVMILIATLSLLAVTGCSKQVSTGESSAQIVKEDANYDAYLREMQDNALPFLELVKKSVSESDLKKITDAVKKLSEEEISLYAGDYLAYQKEGASEFTLMLPQATNVVEIKVKLTSKIKVGEAVKAGELFKDIQIELNEIQATPV